MIQDNASLKQLQQGPLLVASLDGDDLPTLLEQAKAQRADMVELRMDLWGPFFREGMLNTLARFKKKIGIPMMISFRGGQPFPTWWQPVHWQALAAADVIDVEWNPKYPWKDIRRMTQALNLGLIVSHHNYQATPAIKTLDAFIKVAQRHGADIVKIATKVRDENDLRVLVMASRHFGPKSLGTVMGMGPWGGLSRYIAPVFGSCLVYGFIGSATAVGQSPYKELMERMRSLSPRYEAGFQARQKKRGDL